MISLSPGHRIPPWLLSLVLVVGCLQLDTPPAHVDLSTPKSAALAYVRAIQRADGGIARGVAVGSADQKQWIDALVAMVDGMRRFDNSLYAKFGRISSQVHVDMRDALRALADEPVDLVADGNVVSSDTRARIDPPRRGFTSHFQPSIYLLLEKGMWKVDLAQTYAQGVSPEKLKDVSDNFRRYRQFGEVFRQVVRDVSGGQFRSVNEASQALADRLAEVKWDP